MAGRRNKIFGCIALLRGVTLVASIALGQTTKQDCFMQMNFDVSQMGTQWRAVNDGVMGGLSRSEFTDTGEGYAVFRGAVSLDNNG